MEAWLEKSVLACAQSARPAGCCRQLSFGIFDGGAAGPRQCHTQPTSNTTDFYYTKLPTIISTRLRDPIPNYGLSAVLGIGGTKFGNLQGAVHV